MHQFSKNHFCLILVLLSCFMTRSWAAFSTGSFDWGPMPLKDDLSPLCIPFDITDAPQNATVTSIDVYFDVISNSGTVSLSDQDSNIPLSNLCSTTIKGITSFNGRPVNQRWTLSFIKDNLSLDGSLNYCCIKINYQDSSTYCNVFPLNYEYISRVQLNTIDPNNSIDNISQGNRYSDYTSLSTDLQVGQSCSIAVTNSPSTSHVKDQCGIWIDWNQDFDFDDTGESMVVSGSPGKGPYTALITVPQNAVIGQTRMRVRITYSAVPNPCTHSDYYGEVEDYSINVLSDLQFFNVSGHIKLWNQTPLSNVQLQFYDSNDNPTQLAATTDANGYYQFIVPRDWSGHIHAEKDNYVFSRPQDFNNITYHQTQNFTAHYEYSGGLGTDFWPYQISSDLDVNAIGSHPEDWNRFFFVTNNIDLSTIPNFNVIGSPDNSFNGFFDGQNYTINNFTSCPNDSNNIGLFSTIGTSGIIQNLQLKNVNINPEAGTTCDFIGALVGKNNGSIFRCASSGQIAGSSYIGGLVGSNSGSISQCSSTANVTGQNYVAAFVGDNDSNIADCYAKGSVLADNYPGGFAGFNSGQIANCYSIIPILQFAAENTGLIPACFNSTQATKLQATYSAAGWDFNTPIWKICDGSSYPILAWQTLSGDFSLCPNGVDFSDYALFAAAWHAQPGLPYWNPVCDISKTKDNLIDWKDLAVLAENWLSDFEP